MRRKTLDAVERERERRLLVNEIKAYFACKNFNFLNINYKVNNSNNKIKNKIHNKMEKLYIVLNLKIPEKVGYFLTSVQ